MIVNGKKNREQLRELFRAYIRDKRFIREDGAGLKTFAMITKDFKGLIPSNTVIKWLKEFPEVSEQMSTKCKKHSKFYL